MSIKISESATLLLTTKKVGEAVLLVPKEKSWETFLEGINGFSDDFMAEEWTEMQGRE